MGKSPAESVCKACLKTGCHCKTCNIRFCFWCGITPKCQRTQGEKPLEKRLKEMIR